MKKVLIWILALVMVLGLAGCSSKQTEATNTAEPTAEVTQTPEATPEKVTETNYMKVDGIYVDNSYVDEDNSNLKLLYLFYTITTDDKNLSISSNGMTLSIDDTNTYHSDLYSGSCKYMKSYYYKSFIEDIYVGDTLKVVSTFKIPKGDLTAGKSISLKNSSVPDIENILVSTDDIVFAIAQRKLPKQWTPKAWQMKLKKREEADEDTVKKSTKRQLMDIGGNFI